MIFYNLVPRWNIESKCEKDKKTHGHSLLFQLIGKQTKKQGMDNLKEEHFICNQYMNVHINEHGFS
jgi:hypothetical protein